VRTASSTDFNQDAYWPAFRTALIWQALLGVLASLMLDRGQTRRAWGVALVCHLAIVRLIVFRRPRTPTRLNLAIIRYAALPLMIAIAVCGPALLRLLGVPPDMIR
jgi:uncharacterized membrane protein